MVEVPWLFREVILKDYDICHILEKTVPKEADCIDKIYSDKVFKEAILDTANSVINVYLEVEYQGKLSLYAMSNNLSQAKVFEIVGNLSTDDLSQYIQDLIHRLFKNEKKVSLSSFLQGRSGAALVKAIPTLKDGNMGAASILKFDEVGRIKTEYGNYCEFIKERIPDNNATSATGYAFNTKLGVIRYSLIGGELNTTKTFSEFYMTESSSNVEKVLDALFSKTLSILYNSKFPDRPVDIVNNYLNRYYLPSVGTLKHIRDCISYLFPDHFLESEVIFFPEIELEFSNPFLNSDIIEKYSLSGPPIIVHGDLNPNNFLIGENFGTWLIDFALTGPSHIFTDFVRLECALKYELLEHKKFKELCTFENILTKPSDFEDGLGFLPPNFQDDILKNYNAISKVRNYAYVYSRNVQPLREYYIALYLQTLNYFTYHRNLKRKKARKYHILYSLCLLSQKIAGLMS